MAATVTPRIAPASAAAPAPEEVPAHILATALTVSPLPAAIVRLEAGQVAASWANQACNRLLGRPAGGRDVLSGTSWSRLGAAERSADGDPLAELLRRGGGGQDLVVHRSDGFSVSVRVHVFPLPAGTSWALHIEELPDETRSSQAALLAEARMRALAADAPIGIFASEAGLRLGFVNRRAAELLGVPQADLLSTGWMDAIDERDLGAVVDGLAGTLTGRSLDLVLRAPLAPGRWLRLRAAPITLPGQGAGFIGSLEDETVERAHREVLLHQATHDPLTGLPNRLALRTEIDALLTGRRSDDASLALLFLDLDRFKIVNDSLGHAVGDALLKEVAARLQLRVRRQDTLARFGGDEFVLLCPGLSSAAAATRLAEHLLDALTEPIRLEGRAFKVDASVGVVVTTSGATTPELLLRDADIAMYQAKESGRGRVAVFDERVRSHAERRLRVATDLRRALGENELTLLYQPIVDLRRHTLIGAEALLRWGHPDHGSLPINELISMAEETGLIQEVGAWVLERACRDLAGWRRSPAGGPGWVSVNISALQLSDVAFPTKVHEVVARHGLVPADLCIELTEHAVMTSAHVSQDALRVLRDRGFRIAIDDFGTGHSSLAYLKDMPVDVVKIAAPFVAGLGASGQDRAIVGAVIQLAQAIGVDVVAEGVETGGQRAVLSDLACPAAQGYLLGRPGPPEVLDGWTWPEVDPPAMRSAG